MNAFATRIAIECAPARRTTELPRTPPEPAPSHWTWLRRARSGREADVRATPK